MRGFGRRAPPPPAADRVILGGKALLLLAAAHTWVSCQSGESSNQKLVIEGGTLVNLHDGDPMEAAALVIDAGRIACIGTFSDCPVPAKATVIDATGGWLLPGLIDTHVHLNQQPEPLTLHFQYGITTVRDAGTPGDLEAKLRLREWARDSSRRVPRISIASVLSRKELKDETISDRVSFLAKLGVDALKIKNKFSPAEFREIRETTREKGLPVFGHSWAGPPPTSFLWSALRDAEFAGFSHLQGFTAATVPNLDSLSRTAPNPELDFPAFQRWRWLLWLRASPDSLAVIAREMRTLGAWLEPVLLENALFVQPASPTDLRSPALQDSLDRVLYQMRKFVRSFHEAGGQLIAGSDNFLGPGTGLHAEMEQLVLAGLSPAAALRTATLDAARALELEEEIGSLVVGKIADLLILDADPTEDIGNAQRIRMIIKGGHIHRVD